VQHALTHCQASHRIVQGKMEQEKREELIRRGQTLKEELVDYEYRLRELENALQFEAQRLPNLTHPGAAIGGEENAILLKEVGEKITPNFEVFILAFSVSSATVFLPHMFCLFVLLAAVGRQFTPMAPPLQCPDGLCKPIQKEE
jgi:seryl-tRNA synthetase